MRTPRDSQAPAPRRRTGATASTAAEITPARMSFDDCAREAEASRRRLERRMRLERRAKPSRRDAYKAGEVNRLVADWVTSIIHPDDEMRWSLRRMRSRSRDLARNNPYARHFLNMVAVNVVGPHGFQHQAEVRNNDGRLARGINDRIEAGWSEWCEDVTVGTRLSLPEFMRQSIKGTGRDGEGLVRMWRGFEGNRFRFGLEAVDPDQLDEQYSRPGTSNLPEIRLGVEVNGRGRPTAYHVWNRPEHVIGGDYRPRERERLPADEILHLYDQERANQTRGLIWFLAVAVNLKMLDGYTEAELVAARTAAAKQGWFVKKGDPTAGEAVTPDANNRVALEANPGLMDFAPDGYEFEPWTPEHPTTAFAAFVKSKLREVATGVSVSYNALASDLEGVNYSSMRSGLLLEREMWRTMQRWWMSAFLHRVYKEWLNSALLSGALVLDSRDARKFEAVTFTPRGWPWVDPTKEVDAGVKGIQTGLDCRTDILAEQGRSFEYVLSRLAEEQELADEYGVDISGPKPTAAPPADQKKKDDDETDEDEDDDRGVRAADERLDTRTRSDRVAALLAARNGNRNGNGKH